MLLRRLLHGSFWATSEKIVSTLLGLSLYYLLSRLLPPREMGAYFLIMSVVMLAAIVAQLGLNQTIVRLIAESMGSQQPERASATIRKVFLYALVGAVLVFGIMVTGAGRWLALEVFNSQPMADAIVLAAVLVILVTFESLLAETFRGFHDIRFAGMFGGLFSTATSILLFFILWKTYGSSNLTQILIISIAGGIASNAVAGFLLKRKVSAHSAKAAPVIGKKILAIAWPILITNLTLFVLNQMSLWVVGAFQPEKEVAVYGAALRFALLLEKPLLIANAFLPPIIAEMYSQGKIVELERIMRSITAFISIPALILLLGFTCCGQSLLGFIFGDFYEQGITLLILLSFGQFINVWSGSCGITLIMTGNQKYMMTISVCCGLIGTAGAVLLVGDYGSIGVASAFTASLVLQNLLMIYFVWKKVGILSFANYSWSACRETIRTGLREQPAASSP